MDDKHENKLLVMAAATSYACAMSNAPKPLDWAVLILLSLLWAGSFALIKLALISFTPAAIAFGRTAIAAVIVVALVYARGHRFPGFVAGFKSFWVWVIFMGAFGNAIPFTLLAMSEQTISSGLASILNATTPMFVAIFAPFVLPAEHWSKQKLFGVTVGFVGIAVLMGYDVLRQLGGPQLVAQIFALLVAVSYGVHSMIARRMPRANAITIAAGANVCAALQCVPLVMWGGVQSGPLDAGAVASLVALGVGATAMGSVGIIWLINRTSALFVTMVNYIIPPWAVMIGAVFLSENLSPQAYVALFMILLGVAISQRRGKAASHVPGGHVQRLSQARGQSPDEHSP